MSKFELIPEPQTSLAQYLSAFGSFFVATFRVFQTEDLQNALIEAETCMSRAKQMCVEALC